MFLKQEKPEIDDFKRRKTLVLKKSILKNLNILSTIGKNVRVFKGYS